MAGRILAGPVTITATRYPTDAFDYPGMVTVLGDEDLKILLPSSMDDVLKFIPDVEFTGGPRRSGRGRRAGRSTSRNGLARQPAWRLKGLSFNCCCNGRIAALSSAFLLRCTTEFRNVRRMERVSTGELQSMLAKYRSTDLNWIWSD